jgi:parvulin-like peptidyl-prolyl isomerase
MKNWKRVFSLTLAAVLMVGTLAGCNKNASGDTGSSTATATTYDDGTVADLPMQLIGVSADTVLFTVNGNPVTAEEYVYWLGYGISYYENYLSTNYGTEIDWTQTSSDGQTLPDYFKEDAYNTSVFYSIVTAKAAEMNLTLTDTDQKAITDQQTSTIDQLGGQDEYERNLRRAGVSEDTLLEISRASYYYQYLSDKLFGEGSDGYPTDDEMAQYIKDDGWMYAKHILLTTQTAATDATDEEKASIDASNAAQLTLAKSLVAQINASNDPATLFDTLMTQYSQDTGLSSYPNGYSFKTGEMNSDFEAGVQALKIGQISDVVTSSYGYHIIERLNPDTADLRAQYAKDQLDKQIDTWTSAADIQFVNKDAYDKIDVQKFYEDLTAYWAAVDAAADAKTSTSTTDATTTDTSTTDTATTGTATTDATSATSSTSTTAATGSTGTQTTTGEG